MSPEVIAGRYRVERAVGRGGMGTVWLCRDEVLGREVAVKQVGVLPGESVPDLARALREARSSAALNHPHVVSVFDAVEADDHIWLVMEYVPGHTLSELITREGPLDPVRVANIGAQVADGLAAAHARGTIHRDVKPGNILLTDGDVAKISDFGIARTDGDAQLTRSGLVTGTPLYFSPELARGEEPSQAGDVWALGATLYAAVEGEPPVSDRGNAIATLTAIAQSRPPRPQHAGFLTDAIGRMLDPDPASRWSMADAAHALQRLRDQHRPASTLEGGPATTAAPPPFDPDTPVAERSETEPRRRRWGPLLVAAVVLLLLAGIAFAVLTSQGDEPSADPGTGTSESADSAPSDRASDEPSDEATDETTEGSAPSASAPSTPAATESSSAPPAGGSGDAEQTVVDYYSLLPDDTEDAWQMLGPGARSDAGGYGRYRGFWNTIDSVQVDGTSIDGDVVSVDLTYNGNDSETRQLQMSESDGRWLIADDLSAS